MLNSNFDLRTFLTESKASTEQIQEAILTEATVMEYIREKMDSMNDEVRSCMREYLERCNEIDMEHEDAHAQLMNALEDFYNKLKAHFEEDEADMEEPLATTEPAPSLETEEIEEGPVYPEDKHLMTPDEFGGEEDEVNEKAEIHTAHDGSKHKLSYNVYVNGEKVANFEDEAKADAEVKRYREEYKDSKDVASSSIFVKRVMDPINEDYEPRTKEDLVYQYLRDAWQLGAMKGKDVNPDEELSTMADSLLANLPDYDSRELKEETLNEDAGMYQPIVDGIMNLTNNKETALLIAGLVKTAVNVGTVPALAAALYVHKDKPLVRKVLDLPIMQKAVTAMVGDDEEA